MKTLDKVYFFSLSKASSQSFHLKIVNLFLEAGIDQEPDIQETFALYRQETEEMERLVSFPRQLEHTKPLQEARQKANTLYRYMYAILRNLELQPRDIEPETCQRVKNEIIQAFPLSILRLPFHDSLGLLIAFRAHVQNSWMPLFEHLDITKDFSGFSEQLDLMLEFETARADEKASKEKGQSRRVMAELAKLYTVLTLYLEAWSNTISSSPILQERQQRSLQLLKQINEVISSLRHSLAVSASNRRRAKREI